MRIDRLVTNATVLLLAASAVTIADSRITYKSTDGQTDSQTAMLIGHGRIRSDADADTSVIIDPGAGEMTLLDHGKKTYTKITKADLDRLATMVGDAMKQLEAAMANVPPEMRERMRSMMAGRGNMGGAPAAIEVTDTGRRDRVAGHPCRIFESTLMGRVVSETCLGEPSAFELPAEDRATMTAALNWTKDLTASLAQGPLASIGSASPFRDGLVALRTTKIATDGSRKTSEFAGIGHDAIPASAFAVPDGYKEQKLEMPGRGRGGR